LNRLGNTLGHARNHEEEHNRKECGQDRREEVLHTTVLGRLHELLNDPTSKVIPAEGRSEAETGNNRIEGLGFEFLGHEGDSLRRVRKNFGHFYII